MHRKDNIQVYYFTVGISSAFTFIIALFDPEGNAQRGAMTS